MSENENPVQDPVCPDLVEYAEDAFFWCQCYYESDAYVKRLLKQVEELQAHAQAVQDGLDQELYG